MVLGRISLHCVLFVKKQNGEKTICNDLKHKPVDDKTCDGQH